MGLRVATAALSCLTLLVLIPMAQATLTSVADPGNVLAGATTFASSEIAAAFPSSHAVDDNVRFCCSADQDHGLIFSNSDSSQRVGMSGSFGAVESIRLWTIPSVVDARIPNSVTVRSSLNSHAGASLITVGNFETLLGNFSLGAGAFTGTAPNTDNTYATIAVAAPSGTQSLFFSFGGVGDGKGERIAEIQAFVPEPSTVTLLGLVVLGLMCRSRRRA